MIPDIKKIHKSIHMLKTIRLCHELGLNPCNWSHFKTCADMVVLNESAV